MVFAAAIVCLGGLGCGSVNSHDDAGGGSGNDAGDQDSGDGGGDGGGSRDAAPDGGEADAMIVAATCEDVPICGLAGSVGSAADIAAIGDECPLWGNADIDRFRPRTPTFVATTSISVCPDDFTPPADCQDEPLCGAGFAISVDPQLDGVDQTVACSGAQFAAGVRFRVRFSLDPPTVGFQFRTPHIHFERPCDAECADGEHRCEAIDNCYRDDDYCLGCGFGTAEECACRTPDITVLPDCTECEYQVGDQVFLGACFDAICDPAACDVDCTCT
jgi:hypothetical protein